PTTHFTQFRIDPKRLNAYDLALPRYNGFGGTIPPPKPLAHRQGLQINKLPNEPIIPPNPNKMKPLAPSLTEPAPHYSTPPCVLANIRQIEYSNTMPSQLRAYQATVFQALAH